MQALLQSLSRHVEKADAKKFALQELTVLGSRCGPMSKALHLLTFKSYDSALTAMITAEVAFEKSLDAIELAKQKSSIKVQLVMKS